ncbi:MAG: hypothetical protein ACI4RT_01460 [Candidatus Spyradenecus sp.]
MVRVRDLNGSDGRNTVSASPVDCRLTTVDFASASPVDCRLTTVDFAY